MAYYQAVTPPPPPPFRMILNKGSLDRQHFTIDIFKNQKMIKLKLKIIVGLGMFFMQFCFSQFSAEEMNRKGNAFYYGDGVPQDYRQATF